MPLWFVSLSSVVRSGGSVGEELGKSSVGERASSNELHVAGAPLAMSFLLGLLLFYELHFVVARLTMRFSFELS